LDTWRAILQSSSLNPKFFNSSIFSRKGSFEAFPTNWDSTGPKFFCNCLILGTSGFSNFITSIISFNKASSKPSVVARKWSKWKSFNASTNLGLENQRHLTVQCVVTFASLTAVQSWGHFGLHVFTPAHIIPFVFSFFLIGIQFVLYKFVYNESRLEKKRCKSGAKNTSIEKASEDYESDDQPTTGRKRDKLRKNWIKL